MSDYREYDFLEKFIVDVKAEVAVAREIFPTNEKLGYAFVEESGELMKALLNFHNLYLKTEKPIRQTIGRPVFESFSGEVYKEAVQTCAMLFRLLTEGSSDLKFEGFLKKESLDDIANRRI